MQSDNIMLMSMQDMGPTICALVHPGKISCCDNVAAMMMTFWVARAGSDMRALVQEACQGPVRDAVAKHSEKLAALSEADLRPLVLRDFQVCYLLLGECHDTHRAGCQIYQSLCQPVNSHIGRDEVSYCCRSSWLGFVRDEDADGGLDATGGSARAAGVGGALRDPAL